MTVAAIVHLHTKDALVDLTFSSIDMDSANGLWEKGVVSSKLVFYVSINNGQYLLRYDPEQYTITTIPGIWGQGPGGFIP